jgi:hypothetical protein
VDRVQGVWDKVQWRKFVKIFIYLIPDKSEFSDKLSDYQLLNNDSVPYN